MDKASDIVERYNKNNKKEVVAEDVPKLNREDLKAKAIVESLCENNFSIDVPTRKDALSELMRLAESSSPIAKRFIQLLDDVASATHISEDGVLTVKSGKIKSVYNGQ